MRQYVILVVLFCVVFFVGAIPQIKSVKGGHSGSEFPYNATANLVRFWGAEKVNQSSHHNTSLSLDFERGVCYIEVPTASLVKNSAHIPAGNGSRPDLSRIRSCCQGYIRNIHNFRLCDPVCTTECVNALCSAPEICTCFPNHVKNLAGICIPTCPIGCQNGHCSGGECMCKEGYQLDRESKFCYPLCRDNCGHQGNCTAPNTCECNKGFQFVDGSCKPHCERCTNGECVAPNTCNCRQGYTKKETGECQPDCQLGCGPNGNCVGPNTCSCPQGLEFDEIGRVCRTRATCSRPCYNGECVGHNECKCNNGYTKSEYGECIPSCSPSCGPNSQCVGPNTCACAIGYQVDTSTNTCRSNNRNQQGQCTDTCVNGVCTGGVCNCNSGYELDKEDGNRCIPYCPGGCLNGTCSSPNFCICNMGYFKDRSVKGRQTCVRRVRRSANVEDQKPSSLSKLLIFELPQSDY